MNALLTLFKSSKKFIENQPYSMYEEILSNYLEGRLDSMLMQPNNRTVRTTCLEEDSLSASLLNFIGAHFVYPE